MLPLMDPPSMPVPSIPAPLFATSTPVVAKPEAVPQPAHDVPTAPAKLPFEPLPPPPVPVPALAPEPAPAVARTKSASMLPPMDDLDESWDMPEDDPTAAAKPAETTNTPSSSEMAGDGAPGGDGIDEPGWD
jgi:hypothetical protein